MISCNSKAFKLIDTGIVSQPSGGMADARDLKSRGHNARAGSSPASATLNLENLAISKGKFKWIKYLCK